MGKLAAISEAKRIASKHTSPMQTARAFEAAGWRLLGSGCYKVALTKAGIVAKVKGVGLKEKGGDHVCEGVRVKKDLVLARPCYKGGYRRFHEDPQSWVKTYNATPRKYRPHLARPIAAIGCVLIQPRVPRVGQDGCLGPCSQVEELVAHLNATTGRCWNDARRGVNHGHSKRGVIIFDGVG
jgi:hypothetical protein